MEKVEMLVSRSGPAGAVSPGDVIEVSREEAKRMFEASPPQARPVRMAVEPERTNRKAGERAAKS